MAQNYFVWKGIDSRSMGIILSDPVPIIRPEERVEHIQIPGRSGDLTELEGEAVFNSYIQTVSLIVRGGYRIREIYNWLRGSGYVTFSGDPDKRQPARVVGAVTLTKHSRNLDMWVGEVQFYCQPLKENLEEKSETVTGTAFVYNNGDVLSKPLYKFTYVNDGQHTAGIATIHVSGNDQLPTPTVDMNRIIVRNLTGGDVVWVDSETMTVLNGARTEILNANTSGFCPVMGTGQNTISGYGWSSLEIWKRERFL